MTDDEDKNWEEKIIMKIENNMEEFLLTIDESNSKSEEKRIRLGLLCLLVAAIYIFDYGYWFGKIGIDLASPSHAVFGQFGDFMAVGGVVIAVYGLLLVTRQIRENSRLMLLNTYLQIKRNEEEADEADAAQQTQDQMKKDIGVVMAKITGLI